MLNLLARPPALPEPSLTSTFRNAHERVAQKSRGQQHSRTHPVVFPRERNAGTSEFPTRSPCAGKHEGCGRSHAGGVPARQRGGPDMRGHVCPKPGDDCSIEPGGPAGSNPADTCESNQNSHESHRRPRLARRHPKSTQPRSAREIFAGARKGDRFLDVVRDPSGKEPCWPADPLGGHC